MTLLAVDHKRNVMYEVVPGMNKTLKKLPKEPSYLETMLDDQMCMAGITPDEAEYQAIPGRRFRWDFAWLSAKLLVEVQGAVWVRGGHSTGTGITRDAEKLNLATLAGWRTLIVTADHVKSGQALKWIQEALGAYCG